MLDRYLSTKFGVNLLHGFRSVPIKGVLRTMDARAMTVPLLCKAGLKIYVYVKQCPNKKIHIHEFHSASFDDESIFNALTAGMYRYSNVA